VALHISMPRQAREVLMNPSTSVAIAFLALSVVGSSPLSAQLPDADARVTREIEAWRAQHEADYRRDYVPLAGLFYLKEGANTAGSAPTSTFVLPKRLPASIGRFVYDKGRARFEPARGAGVLVDGKPATAPVDLRPDGEAGPANRLAIDDVELWLHKSGDRRAIRMRDPQGDVAKSFTGFKWFPIDLKYRVVGRFIKDAAPREMRIPSLVGDYELYTTEGVVEFTVDGRTLRMRPMTTRPGRLFFVFRDATSGKETYEAARFLYADLRPDGTTVLDFNEAYNPPCAFNEFTTCPLPLPENRLPVALRVGEKAYQKK
jgi:uncharacterized protein (DUF1684 family)